MASSLLNRLKLRAGESVDTIDPNDPYKYVNKYLKEYNITNPYIINAIKGVISSEGGIKGKPEVSYANTTAKDIKRIFGARASKYTDAELDVIKEDPVKFWDMVYGPEAMKYYTEKKKGAWNPGNDQPGDGYKYRGRGLNQLTFKSQYKAVSDRLKKKGYDIDLVKNPELLDTDPDIQALVAIEFMTDRLNTLSNSKGNVYKEKRKQYNVNNWKDIDDQETASLVLANVQSGFGKTPRKEYQENVYNASVKFIPVQPTEGSRLNLVAKKANQAVEQPDVDEVLADIKYKPQIPRMPFGNNEEDIIQYSKDIDAYNDAINRPSIDEAADQEMAAYEANPQEFDSYENYTKLEEVEDNFQTNPNDFENTMTDEEYEALNISNPKNAVVDSDFNEDDYMDLPEVTVSAKKSVVGDYGPEVEADLSKYDNLEFLNNSSSPRSTISEGSFTNEARSKEQLKRDAAAQKFISDPLQQSAKPGYFGSGQSIFYPSRQNQRRSGGSLAPIIPEYYKSKGTPIYRDTTSLPFNYGGILENGGPGNGMFAALDTIDNLQKDYYQSMSPSKFQNLQLNVDETLKQYEKEKARTSGVQKNAFELAQKLANNTDVEGKQHYYNKARTEEVGGNAQDWEAINMGFVNNPDSWIRNIKDPKRVRVDDEGNMIPYTKDGYGCIGASCGIYAKAGATQKEDYGTGFGKKTIKAGEPIFKQTGNKFLDANNYAALKAKGFTQSDVANEGAIARVRYPNQSTTHSFIVGKKQNGEVQEFYENPGNLDSGIEKTGKEVFDYYKPNLTYWNYTGNTEDLNKKYKNLLAQKEAYNRYNVPEKLKTRKAEFSQEPIKMPFVLKKQSYPNTRKGRKQEKQNNAYVEAYMNKLQKK